MVKLVVRLPCGCRKVTLGKEVRYCFGVGVVGRNTLSDLPELVKEHEVLRGEEAKKVFREFDDQGLIHSIWTFRTPYIGGICNCDHDCLPYKMDLDYDFPVYFKAEYLGVIDWDSCSGCKECKKFCQYGAIHYSVFDDKCIIDQRRCYGCGVCRTVCPNDAITLNEREKLRDAVT